MSKEQTTLFFCAPCFSQQYPYARTVSVYLLSNWRWVLIATVCLNLSNNNCVIQSSQYEFHLIDLPPWSPGRHNHKLTAWKVTRKGSRDTPPRPMLWHRPYSSLHPQGPEAGWRLLCLHKPLSLNMPSNQQLPTSQPCHTAVEGNWLVMNSPLFAPSADIALLFLPLVYLQAHKKCPSTEKSIFYPQDIYKQEMLTF